MNKRQPSELAIQVASEWLKEQVPNQRFSGDFRPDHIASLAQRIDAAIKAAVRKCLPFAHHRNSCKGFPAFSDEQLIRDCDCGFVALFGKDYMERGSREAAKETK